LLVLPIAAVVAVLAFVGVSASSPSTPVPSANQDGRFALSANAAASQYCPNNGTACGGKGGGHGHHHHGTGHGGGHGSGNRSGRGGHTGTTTNPQTLTTPAAAAGAVNASANPNVGVCGPQAYSQQTLQGFAFDNGFSGDINLYGDTMQGAGSGVSGDYVVLGSKQAAGDVMPAGTRQIYGGGANAVLGDSRSTGSGLLWNVGIPQASRYVGQCSFWPVDPWGRWGFQLYCNQSVPCHDNAAAQSQVLSGDRRVWRNVTGSHPFTIQPHRSVLVDLTLNALGDKLLIARNGTLAGRILARTVKNPAEPYVLHGKRSFKVYYARCIVWGPAQPVSQTLEARFASSALGRAYRTKNLGKLAPNVSLSGTCVA
jgi:hypothetical protein